LRTLAEHKAADALISCENLQRAHARAAAFAAFADAWRIGRARPLTASDLLSTDCVSDVFTDDILRLLSEVDGDVNALLQALDNGKLPRWRKASTEKLIEALERDNRLPRERPLDEAELRARAYAQLQSQGFFDPNETYAWAL
jgi:hypothetical protein